MQHPKTMQFDDIQGLVRYGYGKLSETCFLLLDIADEQRAKAWLAMAPVTSAVEADPPPAAALQIAFSIAGLRALGLDSEVLDGFSDEFIVGMAGDESRSRRLGDVGTNAPSLWDWGSDPETMPHVLLLLYARPGQLAPWRAAVEGEAFKLAFRLRRELPTNDRGGSEPFGFADGISQPEIDWQGRQSADTHDRGRYSNLLAPGEVVLGQVNEYGLYTARPQLRLPADLAATRPTSPEQPTLQDFGRNGSYLVLRHLAQDVVGFWRFIDQQAGSDPERREQLAAAMVGRRRDGTPLVAPADQPIAGIDPQADQNRFHYDQDPLGHGCPLSAHIRRANPRTGDRPSGPDGLFARLCTALGFGRRRPEEDLVAASRFHRLLRRGRAYGPSLSPEEALGDSPPAGERGLQFIALMANIGRQFEFVQNAWIMGSTFAGVQEQQDPLLGNREPLGSGRPTDQFHLADPAGPARKIRGLPQFVTVRGGGYFFLPGLRALRSLATITSQGERT